MLSLMPTRDASYVESGTVGHKDLYAYQDLTGTPAAIMAVQVATVARKDDAGSRSLRAVLKSGATTANGATRVLGTSYALHDDRFEVDPATGAAWTKAGVDALAGRGGGGGVTVGRVSQAAVEVLLQTVPKVRAAQQACEALLQSTPRARLTGQALEVLRSVGEVADVIKRQSFMTICIGG